MEVVTVENTVEVLSTVVGRVTVVLTTATRPATVAIIVVVLQSPVSVTVRTDAKVPRPR